MSKLVVDAEVLRDQAEYLYEHREEAGIVPLTEAQERLLNSTTAEMVGRMERMLKKLQWCDGNETCPVCGAQRRHDKNHEDCCQLGKLFADIQKGKGGGEG